MDFLNTPLEEIKIEDLELKLQNTKPVSQCDDISEFSIIKCKHHEHTRDLPTHFLYFLENCRFFVHSALSTPDISYVAVLSPKIQRDKKDLGECFETNGFSLEGFIDVIDFRDFIIESTKKGLFSRSQRAVAMCIMIIARQFEKISDDDIRMLIKSSDDSVPKFIQWDDLWTENYKLQTRFVYALSARFMHGNSGGLCKRNAQFLIKYAHKIISLRSRFEIYSNAKTEMFVALNEIFLSRRKREDCTCPPFLRFLYKNSKVISEIPVPKCICKYSKVSEIHRKVSFPINWAEARNYRGETVFDLAPEEDVPLLKRLLDFHV